MTVIVYAAIYGTMRMCLFAEGLRGLHISGTNDS